ncbi:MAG: hypothetical protein ACYC5M_18720 [Anaerolineae bacterium]
MKRPIVVRDLTEDERQTLFDAAGLERLAELLHQSPRAFGKPASFWTLSLAAAVSHEQGLTDRPVSYESVRTALQRLGKSWQRAKRWVESPNPAASGPGGPRW